MTPLPLPVWEVAQRIPRLANGSYTVIPLTIYTVETGGTVKCIAQANGKTVKATPTTAFTAILKKILG